MLVEGFSEANHKLVDKHLNSYGGHNVIKRYTSTIVEDGKVVAMAVGSVYPDDISRACQWNFGANRDRRLWIDYIFADPEHKGYGSRVLREMEEALSKHAANVPKPNIYVMSVHASMGFFDANGYTGIYTPDTADDDDYPHAFCSEVGWWFAKPIDSEARVPIDEEVCNVTPANYGFGSKSLRWTYARLFNEPVPLMDDMIRFFENREDYDEEWIRAMAARLKDKDAAQNMLSCHCLQ